MLGNGKEEAIRPAVFKKKVIHICENGQKCQDSNPGPPETERRRSTTCATAYKSEIMIFFERLFHYFLPL